MAKFWRKWKYDFRFWVAVLSFSGTVTWWIYDVSAQTREIPALKEEIITMRGDIKTINQRVEDIWKAMGLNKK